MALITYGNEDSFRRTLKDLEETHKHDIEIKDLYVRHLNHYDVVLVDHTKLYVYIKHCSHHAYIVDMPKSRKDEEYFTVWRDDKIVCNTMEGIKVMEFHDDHAELFNVLGVKNTLIACWNYGNSQFQLAYMSDNDTPSIKYVAKLNKYVADDGSTVYAFTNVIPTTDDDMRIETVNTSNDEYIAFGRSDEDEDRGCGENVRLIICKGLPINTVSVPTFRNMTFEEFDVVEPSQRYKMTFEHEVFGSFVPVKTYDVDFNYISQFTCSNFNGVDETVLITLDNACICTMDNSINPSGEIKPHTSISLILNANDLHKRLLAYDTISMPVAINQKYAIGNDAHRKSDIMIYDKGTTIGYDVSGEMIHLSTSINTVRFVKNCYIPDDKCSVKPLIVSIRFI
jgi:hypothetical protein